MPVKYKCPGCNSSLSIPSGKVGQSVKCPKCQQRFVAPPVQQKEVHQIENSDVAIDTSDFAGGVSRAASRSQSGFQRYMHWCGTRSFIFQTLLGAWTAFMLMFLVLMMLSAVQSSRESRSDDFGFRRRSKGADGFALLVAMACPLAIYSLVAIPLGVGALATLESNPPQLDKSTAG